MLCISAEETQKGKPNSVSHDSLIRILVERSLRDSSPISWENFIETKTLQLQVNPISQNLENEEETIEPIQNLVEKEKEPSPKFFSKPNLEDEILSSSRDKYKSKVSPNLEKEMQNPSIKVTKRKRFVPIVTYRTTSTTVMPNQKWTHEVVEAEEVLVHRSPHMQG